MDNLIFTDTLQEAFLTAGLDNPGLDRRFSTNNKSGDKAGWLIEFSDGTGAVFGDWRTGEKYVWQRKREGGPKVKVDVYAIENARKEANKKLEQNIQKAHAAAAGKARALWNNYSGEADANHPYLVRKRLPPLGLRQFKDNLLVPVYSANGETVNLQTITPEGKKRFSKGGEVKGCFGYISGSNELLYVCEGWATGAALHMLTRASVACAMSAGNLLSVTGAVKAAMPGGIKIVVAGDDDRFSNINPGRDAANNAALVHGLEVAFPTFAPDSKGTDFADMWLELQGDRQAGSEKKRGV